MKAVFKLLVVLVICFAGIGLYRGWFSFSSTNGDTASDKINVGVSLDKSKMKEDVSKAKAKVAGEVKGAVEKVKDREAK